MRSGWGSVLVCLLGGGLLGGDWALYALCVLVCALVLEARYVWYEEPRQQRADAVIDAVRRGQTSRACELCGVASPMYRIVPGYDDATVACLECAEVLR